MIIFDLHCIADDSHRRHFIEPSCNPEYEKLTWYGQGELHSAWVHKTKVLTSNPPQRISFQPDYAAYNAACDRDEPVQNIVELYSSLTFENPIRLPKEVEVWSSRSEIYRSVSSKWCERNLKGAPYLKIRMRPIGDDSPQEELFERWLHETTALHADRHISLGTDYNMPKHPIEMIFSSHKPTIDMFRRRGVFVFDCNQGS